MDIDYAELQRTADRRVCVGSGDFPLEYFLNIDEDESKPAQIHAHVPPLPFEDASLDLVWGCHFLEHLERTEAIEFVQEAYRVLVPGGHIGIVVPDTREIMHRCLEGEIDAVQLGDQVYYDIADLDSVCALFLYGVTQRSPHRWSYDHTTLRRLLAFVGFGEFMELDRYRDPRIYVGAWYQFGLEGAKPK